MKLVIDLDDTWSYEESISAAIKESIEAEIGKEKSMSRDNHYGPRFDDVKKAFPNATRFHWHVNAFGPERHWMVATPSKCADGVHTCNIWRTVELDELDGLLQ